MKKHTIFQRNFSAVIPTEANATDVFAFHDVAIISVGAALGHGFSIDAKSLETLLNCVKGRKVKAYNNHCWSPNPSDALGVFEDFYIDGEKLKAKTFTFFKSTDATIREKLVEMAQVCPSEFGTSVRSDLAVVYVFDDGTEADAYQFRDKPENVVGDAVARFIEIDSIDFVSEPAANGDGLFSAKENQHLPTKTQTKGKQMKKALSVFHNRFGGDGVKVQKALSRLVALSEDDITEEKANELADEIEKEVADEQKDEQLKQLKTKLEEAEKTIADLKTKLEEAQKAEADAKAVADDEKAKADALSKAGVSPIDTGSVAKADLSKAEFEQKYIELSQKGDTDGIRSLFAKYQK